MKKLSIAIAASLAVAITTLALIQPKGKTTQLVAEIGVSYSLVSNQLTLHEPVILTFTVENKLGEAIKLDLGQDRKGSFLFNLTQPDGTKIELPRFHKLGLSRVGTLLLEPGQTYAQDLLLNEWFEFRSPGIYKIEAWLTKPIVTQQGTNIAGIGKFHGVLEIRPRNALKLKRNCAALMKRIIGSKSFDEAKDATLAMSYINDPVAVPYLEGALVSGHMVESVAVSGLERIDGNEATESLIHTLKTQPPQMVEELIRPALQRISANSADSTLKEKIKRALSDN